MARWSWRTLPDGRVEVDKGSGFSVPLLPDERAPINARLERVLQWLPLAEKYSLKYDVPVSWILGFMYAESGGDPSAENFCCVGLLAIFVKGKNPAHPSRTRAQMLDPEQNLDYGTSLLADSRARGHDLPATASVHVGGGGTTGNPWPSTASPWGMREHMWKVHERGDDTVGYIDQVVRASNTLLDRLGARVAPEPPTSLAGAVSPLLPFAVGGLLGFALVSWSLPRLP
jgi:soluble lytic murein transglycosylase-like protein